MSETLTIRNFGPIKDVALDLKKFNVIIGENATGKSTIAKVLAVCRYFSFIYPEDDYSPLKESQFEKGLELWGLAKFVKNDSLISYECKHYSLTVKNIPKTAENSGRGQETGEPYGEDYLGFVFTPVLISLSLEFEKLLSDLEKLKPEKSSGFYSLESDTDWMIPYDFFNTHVSKLMDNPFYFHTERGLQSIFSLGKNSIPNMSDSLYKQFTDLDRISKAFKSETVIEPLGIIYKNINGYGYIKKNNEEDFYSLNNGASGYQSTIPIVLVIKYYTESKFNKKNKTFIIEEPELNLYPKAQKKLMEYLVDKTVNYGNSILLTTHSPYILTSLNNLMYAYEVGQKYEVETNNIVEKKYWLNPQEVSTYRLLPDGTTESIIDKDEEGATLITAEKIDEVSTVLNKVFNKLIDLEIINENVK